MTVNDTAAKHLAVGAGNMPHFGDYRTIPVSKYNPSVPFLTQLKAKVLRFVASIQAKFQQAETAPLSLSA
jgi:hypothetical protein